MVIARGMFVPAILITAIFVLVFRIIFCFVVVVVVVVLIVLIVVFHNTPYGKQKAFNEGGYSRMPSKGKCKSTYP